MKIVSGLKNPKLLFGILLGGIILFNILSADLNAALATELRWQWKKGQYYGSTTEGYEQTDFQCNHDGTYSVCDFEWSWRIDRVYTHEGVPSAYRTSEIL